MVTYGTPTTIMLTPRTIPLTELTERAAAAYEDARRAADARAAEVEAEQRALRQRQCREAFGQALQLDVDGSSDELAVFNAESPSAPAYALRYGRARPSDSGPPEWIELLWPCRRCAEGAAGTPSMRRLIPTGEVITYWYRGLAELGERLAEARAGTAVQRCPVCQQRTELEQERRAAEPNVECARCHKTIWADYKRVPDGKGGWLHVRCAQALAQEAKP